MNDLRAKAAITIQKAFRIFLQKKCNDKNKTRLVNNNTLDIDLEKLNAFITKILADYEKCCKIIENNEKAINKINKQCKKLDMLSQKLQQINELKQCEKLNDEINANEENYDELKSKHQIYLDNARKNWWKDQILENK